MLWRPHGPILGTRCPSEPQCSVAVASERAQIRPATEDDLDAIIDQTWEVAAEGRWIGREVPFDRQERQDRLASALCSASSALFVATASMPSAGQDVGDIVGHIWVSLAPYGVADFGLLVVQGWRGHGVGKLLLDAGLDWARGAGAHKAALEVWPHNEAAIALYRRAGFVEEGRKVRHYRRHSGELWDAIVMGLHL